MKSANIMGRMTARDISKNLLQYLAMIIITCLAVTLFCGFISNAQTLDFALDEYYKKANLTDYICQYSVVTAEDKQFLESLGADELEYRIVTEGSAGRRSAKIFVVDPNNAISLPVLSEGKRGVLVDKLVAQRDKLSVGDTLDLEIQVSQDGERTPVSLAITGFMSFAEAANISDAYSPVYIDYPVLFKAMQPSAPALLYKSYFDSLCTQVLIKTDSPQIKQQIIGNYEGKDNSGFVFVMGRDSMESVVLLDGEISQSLKMIYVFPVIFMMVSVLVILSTIGPLILRERTNIGVLKSIGISDKRILTHYSMFGVVLCFIGGVLGVIAGPLIIPKVLLIKYGLVYSLPPFPKIVFSPLWSVVAVSVVCLLAALIGFVVCKKTCAERPAACLRPLAPKMNFIISKMCGRTKSLGAKTENQSQNQSQSNVLENENSSVFGNQPRKDTPQKTPRISMKMAIRNIIIKPSRAVMTVVGVMGCVALLVCSFGIGDTVNNSIDFELGKQFSYDISTTISRDSESEFLQAMERQKAEGKVQHYEVFKTFSMSAKGSGVKNIKVLALPQNPQLTAINPQGKTLISKSVAEDIGVGVGDTVVLSAAGGAYTVTVDEVIETSFTKGVFVTDSGEFDECYHSLGMWIKTDNAEQMLEYVNTVNGTGAAFSMQSLRGNINNVISSIQTIKLTMMLFSVALAVVVLYNLSLLNIKERSRDIATMKVLGISSAQVGKSLLFEIMLLVLAGTLFGLLLGYPMTVLVMSINRIEILTFLYHIKPISYLFSALISVATALIINLFFARHIRKINMTESLKSVE